MYLIVTNNPMAAKEFAGQGEVRLYPEDTYREILVRARDLVYIGHRLQPSAVRQSAAPRDALSHGSTVGSAPDSGRGGVPHHVGGHHPHRYLHAAGSGEDAPAYSGGLSDDRLLSGEEYLRLLSGAYEKRRTAPDT